MADYKFANLYDKEGHITGIGVKDGNCQLGVIWLFGDVIRFGITSAHSTEAGWIGDTLSADDMHIISQKMSELKNNNYQKHVEAATK